MMKKSDAVRAIIAAILAAPHLELIGESTENALAEASRHKRNKRRLDDALGLVDELV